MYESHHQPDTLTDMDYQLMLEANAFAKCDPNMVDFNHPDYMTLMQAPSLPLEPSLVDQSYHHEDTIIGSDSSSSSNEQLYYSHQNQQQQHHQNNPSLDLQQSSSTASSLQIHFSNTEHSAPAHNSSMFMASSAPVSSSMAPITNNQSNTDHSSIITQQNIPAPSSSSSSSLSSASNYAPTNNHDCHQPQNHQYHDPLHHQPYRQNYGNGSDPSVYPSLEECVPTTSSTFYNNNNNNDPRNQINSNAALEDMEASQYQHLEQFYGQSLDEQQQFFLMQQHQQQLWAQQQYQQQHHQQQIQQQTGYPPHQHPRHVSPSSSSYTTESDSRPQIYVRKACVACKQSHVACDVQRPCSRCVRLNKAESCVDAERKKRGRPCGSGKKKKEEEKELRRREQQHQQQQQLHLQHSLLR
ncbi:hypothetical protein BCR42DRAFT_432483 [Absidia repens]|uniref:Zn(2)-C6 fungal-type domain-containing protein n=1 Tax=Absidia repens TaxID=90262 RepID=A0A1X2IZ84_9FUNG|nr:hypothetical protein BCR42DRAFT_432483 [Absidia repens]